jgi:hypothetical protein
MDKMIVFQNDFGNGPEPVTIDHIKASFRLYLFYAWRWLELPPPTPVQYDIADFLQSGHKRKIIQAFRGVGKSWITSAYCCWCWLRNPQYKILVVSASKMRSDDFSTFTLRIIKEQPILHHLIPDSKKGDRESKVAFDVAPSRAAHAPSCKSLGITSQLTGSRADEIVADDVEVPTNSATQDLREKLLKTVLEFESIIMPETGKVTYLGTPQTEESIYNKISERGYKRLIWPALYPIKKKLESYGGQLAPMIEDTLMENPTLSGDATDPRRFSMEDLEEKQNIKGVSEFALQFMLDTSLSDAERYPLKTSDIIVTNVDPEKAPVAISYGSSDKQKLADLTNVGFAGDKWYGPMYYSEDQWTEYTGRAMSIDPSGRGADETGYAIGYMLMGNIWIPEVGGLIGGYDEPTLRQLSRIAKKHKVNHIVVESNFGDGMFTSLFQPVLNRYHPCMVEEVRHSTQKELRIIDSLEPSLNQHRLIFDRSVVESDIKLYSDVRTLNRALFYQMTRLTKEKGALKHDDRLDALAILVRYWTDAMAQDKIRNKRQWEQREVDKELKTFIKHAVGKQGQSGSNRPSPLGRKPKTGRRGR